MAHLFHHDTDLGAVNHETKRRFVFAFFTLESFLHRKIYGRKDDFFSRQTTFDLANLVVVARFEHDRLSAMPQYDHAGRHFRIDWRFLGHSRKASRSTSDHRNGHTSGSRGRLD
ncbi:MAG: hypothetical protein R2849_02125 [Thermomicrobiales bacterium]